MQMINLRRTRKVPADLTNRGSKMEDIISELNVYTTFLILLSKQYRMTPVTSHLLYIKCYE